VSWYPEVQEWIANTRLLVGLIVNHVKVQQLILLLIILNSIAMGVATLPSIEENPELHQIFSAVDQIFLIVFTLELLLQWVHPGLGLVRDPWLVFDALVVLASWLLESSRIARAFRIFRVLRLFARLTVCAISSRH
jgi:voltage-gated sodium channel